MTRISSFLLLASWLCDYDEAGWTWVFISLGISGGGSFSSFAPIYVERAELLHNTWR